MKWKLKKLGVVFGVSALAYVASGMAAYYSEETKATTQGESIGGGNAWNRPTEAETSNDVRAYADASAETAKLRCTVFGFSVSGTIDGIEVIREGRSPNPHPNLGQGAFFKLRLVYNNSILGDERTVSGMLQGSTDGTGTDGSHLN